MVVPAGKKHFRQPAYRFRYAFVCFWFWKPGKNLIDIDRVKAASPESVEYCVLVLSLIDGSVVEGSLQGHLSTQERCETLDKVLNIKFD
jgi:hypothetical protein